MLQSERQPLVNGDPVHKVLSARCIALAAVVFFAAVGLVCKVSMRPSLFRAAPHTSAIRLASSGGSQGNASTARFDAWYVNVWSEVQRDHCMQLQLDRSGLLPHRHEADTFEPCVDVDNCTRSLGRLGFGDCVHSGIDWEAVRVHSESNQTSLKVASHVISNWCSHKRLFSELAQNKDAAEFILVLEDDAVLNHSLLKPEVQSFVNAYKNVSWDLVVVDPFNVQLDFATHGKSRGGICDEYKVGSHKGNDVWAIPRVANNATGAESSCVIGQCDFCGAQALLVRKASLGHIVGVMSDIPAVPLDWFPRHLVRSLAWRPYLAMNPHALEFGQLAMEEPCSKAISKSTIDGKDEVSANRSASHEHTYDGLNQVFLSGAVFNHIPMWYCTGHVGGATADAAATSPDVCAQRCLDKEGCVGFNLRVQEAPEQCSLVHGSGLGNTSYNAPCAVGDYSSHWHFYQLLARKKSHAAQESLDPQPVERCTYGFVASRYYLPGLLTMLHSMRRSKDICEYALVWHPSVEDTYLTPTEQDMIRCAVGDAHVRFVRVKDARAKLWSSFPVQKGAGHSALLKLEFFWFFADAADHNHSIVYMDSDMLALQSLSFVHRYLQLPMSGEGPWQLHASFPTYAKGLEEWRNYSEYYAHTGFFAFRTPVPEAFKASLIGIVERCIREGDMLLPVGGDQPAINEAVYSASARLITHLDWYANYRPLTAAQKSWPWRVVHWSGCNKPWGAKDPFFNTSAALSGLDELWAAECAKTQQLRCMDHFHCFVVRARNLRQ